MAWPLDQQALEAFHARHFSPECVSAWTQLIERPRKRARSEEVCREEGWTRHEVALFPSMPSPPPNSTPPNPVIPNAAPTTDDVHGTVMTLSQETIDMFRFSENYRREREAARERARKRKEARKLRLHTTSSPPDTAHPDSPESPDTPDFEHQEPPPDTLVLYDPPPDALHVRLLHTVVNDGYRHTCDEDVTLWPVLPLRL